MMLRFPCEPSAAASPPRLARSRPGRSVGLLLGAALAFVLLVPVAAHAGKIKGRLANYHELVNPVWHDAKDPERRGYSFREIVPTVPAKYRRLFPHIPKEICVAALAAQPQEADRKPVLIRVGGGRTTPVTIVVAPGTRLRFKNTDPFTHRLYAVKEKTFVANDTIKGATRDWMVPIKPGSHEVRDELAPSLRMWIVAEPNVAAIAYPSLAGEFMLTVPGPGEYQVQAYFSGKKVGDPTSVTVETRDVDLSKEAIKVAPDPKKKDNDEKKN
jgi:plastocyanin